jgi:serine/threonine protein kinase
LNFENRNILTLTIMSTSTGRHAILFKESPGYILSRPMLHGSQGQVYLVLSLKDGKPYIRKKLEDHEPFRELPFYHLLPTSMVPELILKNPYPKPKGDAVIFSFCNGGDLRAFMNQFRRPGVQFPEVMLRLVIKKIFEILAFIHHGWRCERGIVTIEEDWHPVIHGDMHWGNISLHWPDEDSLLPSVLLGDWGSAMAVEGPADRNRTVRSDTKVLRADVLQFLNTLIGLSDAGPREIEEKNGPIWQVAKLRKEALELGRRGYDIHISQYIAERLLPMEEEAIELAEGWPSGSAIGETC